MAWLQPLMGLLRWAGQRALAALQASGVGGLSLLAQGGKTAAALAAKVALLVSGGGLGGAITVGTLGLAAAILGYGLYYSVSKTPFPFLPGVPEVPVLGTLVKALPPRYVFSFHGVTSPMGVAVSPDGERIYVTESEGERMVRVFSREGKPLASLAPPGTSPAMRLPLYVAVASNRRVYVTDRLRKTIDIYAPDGAYLGLFQPEGAAEMVPNPLGITTGPKDTLYLTDVTLGIHRVMAFKEEGRLFMAFGREGTGEGEFAYPNALAVNGGGDVFVSDGNNSRILFFDAEGTAKGSLKQGGGEMLGLPRGLALDRLGRLHVVDAAGGRVNVYDVGQNPAKFLFDFGEPGRGGGQLSYPNGIAVDNRIGRAYLADRANHRVSVWAY